MKEFNAPLAYESDLVIRQQRPGVGRVSIFLTKEALTTINALMNNDDRGPACSADFELGDPYDGDTESCESCQ